MTLESFATPLALVVGSLGATRGLSLALRTDDRELPFGARVIAGVALLAIPAGALVAFGVYSRAAVLLLLGAAGACFLAQRPFATGRADETPRGRSLWLLPLLALLIVRAASALRFPYYNACDDWPVYLHFPRLLLESGAFDEPFSLRRLGVLGSGPFLQGFFWPGFGISAIAVADACFGQAAIVGGALAVREVFTRGRHSAAAAAFTAVALLGTLTFPVINTLPVLLPYGGMLLLLALHARMALRTPDASSTRDAVLWGALAAFVIGLRVSNAVPIALLWALGFLHAAWRRDLPRVRTGAIAALSTGLALAPWSVALWRSSGTPLFPLLAGNHRFPTIFSQPASVPELMAFVIECLHLHHAALLVILAGIVWAGSRSHGVIALHALAAALAVVVATAIGTNAFDSWTVFRYCAPLVVPTFLFLGAAVAFAPALRWQRIALAAVAAAWLALPVTAHIVFEAKRVSLTQIAAMRAEEWGRAFRQVTKDRFRLESFGGEWAYEDAQRALPPGARVVSAAEQAYAWRHDLHTVHSLDCLGQASPEPGMPFFQGADAVADYFTALGYTHLAFTPARRSMCLYAAAHWNMNLYKGQWMWRRWAPYFLDFMHTQQTLARTREVVYRGPTLVVVELRERASAP